MAGRAAMVHPLPAAAHRWRRCREGREEGHFRPAGRVGQFAWRFHCDVDELEAAVLS